jgi:hypothetical protein
MARNEPIFTLYPQQRRGKTIPHGKSRLAAEMEKEKTGERHKPIHPMKRWERLTGGNVGP